MKNLLGKNRIGLNICALFVLFSLLFAATTYAWTAANRKVSQINDDMSMFDDDTKATYYAYKYDLSRSTGITIDSISDIEFNPYDLIFTARNRYTPVLVRIEIERNDKMPEEGVLNLTLVREPPTDDGATENGTGLKEYCSSIMRFSAAVLTGTISNDANALYASVDEKLYSITKSYSFCSTDRPAVPASSNTFSSISSYAQDSTYSKVDEITLNVSYKSTDWTTVNDTSVLNVALYITYDEGLVTYYKNQEHTEFGGFTSTMVTFENDLSMIKISYESATAS